MPARISHNANARRSPGDGGLRIMRTANPGLRGSLTERSSLRSAALICMALSGAAAAQDRLERIQYNNPGLVVDLGVGLWAWPLPMDYDRDGDLDLVVAC